MFTNIKIKNRFYFRDLFTEPIFDKSVEIYLVTENGDEYYMGPHTYKENRGFDIVSTASKAGTIKSMLYKFEDGSKSIHAFSNPQYATPGNTVSVYIDRVEINRG